MNDKWIFDLSKLEPDSNYAVASIGERLDKSKHLYNIQGLTGWQAQRLTKGCYAAFKLPKLTSDEINDSLRTK